MKVKGKTALVTGASQGIGKAIALLLAKKGVHVLLVARSRNKLAEVAREITGAGGSAEIHICDVSEVNMIQETCQIIKKQIGSPDILVNAAGFAVWKPFMAISESEHRKMMEVNYWGAYNFIRQFLPAMRSGKSGKIINISAGSGKFALSVTSGFSASKFALTGLSESLNRELAGSGIGISCLHPGSVNTEFWNKEHIDFDAIPPLIRYAPKISPKAVARRVLVSIWFPVPTATFPIFVALLAKLNSIWSRMGDILLWRWFFPTVGVLALIRLVIKYLQQ